MSRYTVSNQAALIANIDSIDKCERYLSNVRRLRLVELEPLVSRRIVLLRAELIMADYLPTATEGEALVARLCQCLAAYEETLKNRYAGRIRPQILSSGFIATVGGLVSKPTRDEQVRSLLALGLGDFAFEVAVTEFPEQFPADILTLSHARRERLGF